MNLLKELYKIHSPSRQEGEMATFVKNWLTKKKIPFESDRFNQVFKLIPGRPIVSCHMDQVQKGSPGMIIFDGIRFFGTKDGLGADDKNGIWVCLNLLARWDVGFIFSTGEESFSQNVAHVLEANENLLRRIPYCLVFDRRGSGDIIGEANGYCTPTFQKKIAERGKAFGYAPTSGVYSDADTICQYCECVNLSVGYHKPHSTEEYTIWRELLNALRFAEDLLENIQP